MMPMRTQSVEATNVSPPRRATFRVQDGTGRRRRARLESSSRGVQDAGRGGGHGLSSLTRSGDWLREGEWLLRETTCSLEVEGSVPDRGPKTGTRSVRKEGTTGEKSPPGR